MTYHHSPDALRAQQWYEEGYASNTIGQRDKACQALKQCLALDEQHGAARSLLAALQQTLHPTEIRRIRIPIEEADYALFAKPVITLGRQEDNDVVLLNTDVSRYHARLELISQTCMAEDLHSSNGTRLNGLRIRHTAVLHNRDVLGIGRYMRFEICLQQHPSGMSAVLRSLESQGLQQYYILFTGDIFVGSEEECEVYIPHLITTDIPYLFKMSYSAPYWYLYIHPHAPTVELNGTSVRDYIVIAPGDALSFEGVTLLFE